LPAAHIRRGKRETRETYVATRQGEVKRGNLCLGTLPNYSIQDAAMQEEEVKSVGDSKSSESLRISEQNSGHHRELRVEEER
jgi:hypothetical protein